MKIDLDDASIFFDVVGCKLEPVGDRMEERATLLVLHGGPGYDHTTLRPHFDRFSDAMQVVYIDHRGCGRSTGGKDTWTLDQWADDVALFCTRLAITKPIVFGQSFGGMVAMHFAAKYPTKLSKLILSSTAAQFRLDETVRMTRILGGDRAGEVARNFFSTPSLDGFREYSEICIPLYTQTNAPGGAAFRNRAIQRPEIAVHFFQNEMKDMDLRREIEAITCPTLVLAGALDPVTPVLCSQEIAKAIGNNARLEVFDGCGHGVHRDDADGSEKLMREFMASS